MRRPSKTVLTVLVTCAMTFMVNLDSLIVTTALPTIRTDLQVGAGTLEWVVNAYTLAFATMLLAGAALGDRFGRKWLFEIGMIVFTLASAGAALSSTIGQLIVARAVQGAGAGIAMPLALTLISAAVRPERRGAALGAWGAVSGVAIAIGPLAGGLVLQYADWSWIFWINVPIGIILLPLAALYVRNSTGRVGRIDVAGVLLAGAGVFALTYGVVRGNGDGWTSPNVLAGLIGGAILLVALIWWESRCESPAVPLRFFTIRGFQAVSLTGLLQSFGVFGAIYLLAQYLQIAQGFTPLEAGVRMLPWTLMPLFIAPIVGPASDRFGSRPFIAIGLALQAIGLIYFAVVLSPSMPFLAYLPAMVIAGVGMAMYFAPMANAVLGSVPRIDEGKASGINNTIRQVGVSFGIAVLGSIFSAFGGYLPPTAMTAGVRPALIVGGVVVLLGFLAAFALPRKTESSDGADPA